MKAIRSTRNQKSNTSRKADVKLTLNLTYEQAQRITNIAKMVGVTPEVLVISQTLTGLDSWGSWNEFTENIESLFSLYTEERREASSAEVGVRMEDDAPGYLKKMTGYVSPEVASAQEVAHG